MVDYEIIIKALIEKSEQEKGVISIRSCYGDYMRPETIILMGKKKKQFVPDLVITYKTQTDVYVIEQGTSYDINKWRLFSLYILKMHGNFHIVAPEENQSHISKILEETSISAKVISF